MDVTVPEPLQFQIRVTRMDLFYHFIRYRSLNRWSVWILPIGYATYLEFFVFRHPHWWDQLKTFLIWGGGIWAATAFLVLIIMAIKISRFDPNGLALEEKQVRVDTTGVTITGSASSGTFAWATIHDIRQSSRLVLLHLTGRPQTQIILPRRDLPDGAVDAMRNLRDEARLPA